MKLGSRDRSMFNAYKITGCCVKKTNISITVPPQPLTADGCTAMKKMAT